MSLTSGYVCRSVFSSLSLLSVEYRALTKSFPLRGFFFAKAPGVAPLHGVFFGAFNSGLQYAVSDNCTYCGFWQRTDRPCFHGPGNPLSCHYGIAKCRVIPCEASWGSFHQFGIFIHTQYSSAEHHCSWLSGSMASRLPQVNPTGPSAISLVYTPLLIYNVYLRPSLGACLNVRTAKGLTPIVKSGHLESHFRSAA